MTRLDLIATLRHLSEEFDRLRLAVADRLTTPEEGVFLGLIFALEETIAGLPTMRDTPCEDHAPAGTSSSA